ncbi:MAG: PTS IIA-like nitrogen regulatory protein PtsN [Alphaproteobacteria bacterium]|nr:PTS IIA-like nitrogen regulatory protein PtsN [Alphaproteobacteria bacterium]
MDLEDLVSEHAIIPALAVESKKQALQALAAKASELPGIDIPAREIFDTLLQRERLGSTGLGRGIAIPHVKFRELDKIHCLFARLTTPIDFEALDDEPVDLVFLLLAPEHASGDHLKALARISRLLREPEISQRLREARDLHDIFRVLTEEPATPHAA